MTFEVSGRSGNARAEQYLVSMRSYRSLGNNWTVLLACHAIDCG
jgi:hypothetical protein